MQATFSAIIPWDSYFIVIALYLSFVNDIGLFVFTLFRPTSSLRFPSLVLESQWEESLRRADEWTDKFFISPGDCWSHQWVAALMTDDEIYLNQCGVVKTSHRYLDLVSSCTMPAIFLPFHFISHLLIRCGMTLLVTSWFVSRAAFYIGLGKGLWEADQQEDPVSKMSNKLIYELHCKIASATCCTADVSLPFISSASTNWSTKMCVFPWGFCPVLTVTCCSVSRWTC